MQQILEFIILGFVAILFIASIPDDVRIVERVLLLAVTADRLSPAICRSASIRYASSTLKAITCASLISPEVLLSAI